MSDGRRSAVPPQTVAPDHIANAGKLAFLERAFAGLNMELSRVHARLAALEAEAEQRKGDGR